MRPMRCTSAGGRSSCHGWEQEGILCCLLNNLDPAVAENCDARIVVIGAEQLDS
jgi:urocanate hydratase